MSERYVYFIKCPKTGYVRIGKTNHVRQKIAEQCVDYGTDFIPLAWIEAPLRENLKGKIAKTVAEFRVGYPWKKNAPGDRLPDGLTDWYDFDSVGWEAILDSLEYVGHEILGFTEADRDSIDKRIEIGILDRELRGLEDDLRRQFYEQHGNYNLNRPDYHE